MRTILALLLIQLSITAHADEWTGPDKRQHLIVGATIGAAGALAFDRQAGFALGAAAGLAKEVYDSRHRSAHTPSAKDFAVTALGAAAGAYVPGLVIGRRSLSYSIQF